MCVCSQMTHSSLPVAHINTQRVCTRARACVHARVCACVGMCIHACVCMCVCMQMTHSSMCVCMQMTHSSMCVCMQMTHSSLKASRTTRTALATVCFLRHRCSRNLLRLGFAIRTQPKPGRFFRERRCQTSVLQCFTVCFSLFQDVKHKVCTPWKSERWGLLQQRWALCQKRRFGGKALADGRRWHRRWHTLQDMKQYTLQAYNNRCALRTHTRHCTVHTRIHDGMSHETHTYISEHIAHTTYFI